jgi:hypothetical protein
MGERPDESVGSEVRCVGCGYDLRGLAPDGTCPECGTPVARALRGDALAAADPDWLRRIAIGLQLVGIGCIVLILRVPVWVMLDALADDLLDARPVVRQAMQIVVNFATMSLLLLGVAWVTTLDPRRAEDEQPFGLRRVARAGAVAALVVALLDEAIELAGGGLPALPSSATAWLSIIATVVAVVASTYYLAGIIDRIPKAALAKRLRSYARVFAIVIPVVAIGDALRPAVGVGSPVVLGVVLTMTVGGGLLALGAGVGLMSSWWVARTALRECLFEAKYVVPGNE